MYQYVFQHVIVCVPEPTNMSISISMYQCVPMYVPMYTNKCTNVYQNMYQHMLMCVQVHQLLCHNEQSHGTPAESLGGERSRSL